MAFRRHLGSTVARRLGGTFSRAFTFGLMWRLATVFVLAGLFAWSIERPQLLATSIVLAGLMLLVLRGLLWHLEHTNREVARLADALAHGDVAQSFHPQAKDVGLAELGQSFEGLLAGLRAECTSARGEASHVLALIDHVPIPLLCLDAAGRVELLNQAARQLFQRRPVTRVGDFAAYGQAFAEGLTTGSGVRVVEICPPDEARARMRVTESLVSQRGQPARLLALQPIQTELDQNELTLSRGLVRVLTHEIMNSLTPVVSLAKSARALSASLPAAPGDAAAGDLRAAIETIERRAEGLMQFAARYRELTVAPQIQLGRIEALALAQDLERLVRADSPVAGLSLMVAVEPKNLVLNADRELLEHALLNILRNAVQASADAPTGPSMRLAIRRSGAGRTVIEVHDNGPGIPSHLLDDVFLPFFTTKPNGSGIGLSLARHIVLAHSGALEIDRSPLGGACLRIVL